MAHALCSARRRAMSASPGLRGNYFAFFCFC